MQNQRIGYLLIFLPGLACPNEHNKFIDIKKAILERKTISFDYVNAEGGRSLRRIEPMRLIFKGQAWYLWGYCRTREDFRTFHYSRMKNVIVTNEAFERRKPDEYRKHGEVKVKKAGKPEA